MTLFAFSLQSRILLSVTPCGSRNRENASLLLRLVTSVSFAKENSTAYSIFNAPSNALLPAELVDHPSHDTFRVPDGHEPLSTQDTSRSFSYPSFFFSPHPLKWLKNTK